MAKRWIDLAILVFFHNFVKNIPDVDHRHKVIERVADFFRIKRLRREVQQGIKNIAT